MTLTACLLRGENFYMLQLIKVDIKNDRLHIEIMIL